MIVGIFAIFEIVLIAAFVWAFFYKHQIVWALVCFLSGYLAFSAFKIEFANYVFDPITQSYVAQFMSQSYIDIAGLNILIFALSLALGAYDLYSDIAQGKRLNEMRQGNE